MKCPWNGLRYPFYIVSAWEWVEDDQKECGGEYELFTLLETEDREKAMEKANSIKISADCIEVIIQINTGEDLEWVGTIDQCGYYDR